MNAVKPAAEPLTTAAGREDYASTKKRSAQLLIQTTQNDDVVVADYVSVPSNTAKRLKQGNEVSNVDTEETTIQDEDGSMLQMSNMKADDIDAPKLEKAVSADNLTMTVSASKSDEEDTMVLKLFEKLNSCIEEGALDDGYTEIGEMIEANNYLVNATCPQTMRNIEVGCTAMEALCSVDLGADTRDLLYEFVCLGGKGTDKCYERIMREFDGVFYAFHFLEVLLLSGYWPTEKSDFLLDALVEDLEDEGEEEDVLRVLRIFYKDISVGEDGFSCGDANSTIINNINGLPPLVVGETHSEGGAMAKLMNRFPCKRVICPTCNVLKLTCPFSEEHNCCYDCERRDFLVCSKCGVSKRRLEHFTAEQSKKERSARCIDCEVFLVCSVCKASKSDDHFSTGQQKKGEAACCKECVNTCLVCSMCKVWKKKSEHFTKSQRNKKVKYAVCRGCEVRAQTLAHTQGTASVNKAGTPVTNVQEKKGGKQRLCSACNISKSYTNFSKTQLGKGEKARCKECVSATH